MNRINKKYVFYWLLAVSFVCWGYSTLYIHSYGNLWGGKDDTAKTSIEAKTKALADLVLLEKNGALPEALFDQRVQLAIQCEENKEHDASKQVLLDETAALVKLPLSEENLSLRVKNEIMLAHLSISEGRYDEAGDYFKTAGELTDQMQNRYNSENCHLLRLVLTHENAVLDYLRANSTLDGKTRASTFVRCQRAFESLIAQIDTMERSGNSITAETQEHLAKMKNRALSNLKQVKEDIDHESDFQQT